jgi:hypothetical protein
MNDEIQPGSAVFGPNQMFAMIQAVGTKVDHLASILDPALTTVREEISDVRKDVDDHESRLRSLDKRIWIAAVLAAGSGAGITQLLSIAGG